MADVTTTVAPVTNVPAVPTPTTDQIQAVIAPLSADAIQAEKDIAALIAAYKSKGASGAAALLPALAPELQTDWKDIQAALPVIKAGYKTSEFWIVVGVIGALAVLAMFGKVPAIDAGSLISALAGVYTVVRGLMKTSTTTAAATVAAA
jgi:hypothetical protein